MAVGDRKALDTRVYHPGTGEILKPNEALLRPGRTWYRFHNPTHQDGCDLYHHDPRQQHGPLKFDLEVSQTTLPEGWVKDPGGSAGYGYIPVGGQMGTTWTGSRRLQPCGSKTHPNSP